MKNAIDADFLIFDLGNVIIDIDYQNSLRLIRNQVSELIQDRVSGFYLTDFHKDYEKGLIDSPTFRNSVRGYFEQDWEDQKVDELWNSLLLTIPENRLELIANLKNKYQIGVLSNTNQIHIEAVDMILMRDHGIENLNQLFHRVFLSHEMGLSKPSPEIYEKMVSELGTTPDRVVFFDDLEANVKGAASVGIQAVHVTGPGVIFDYLKHA
jgi:putative hydrolase of the HAD superfamily